jgi:hypothetical protein
MKHRMRPTILVLTLALAATIAWAGPHFQSATAIRDGSNLVVSFREAGLGNTDVTIQASATVTQQQACFNNGGKNPAAENKRSFTSTESANGTFSPKNGVVSGSISLQPPATGFTCPPGQWLLTLSVTYTNVRVADVTNGVSTSVPGTY